MKDWLQSMEDAATRRLDEMTEGLSPDEFRCDCGKVFPLKDAMPSNETPYAVPMCHDCFDEYFSALLDGCKTTKIEKKQS